MPLRTPTVEKMEGRVDKEVYIEIGGGGEGGAVANPV